MKKMLEIERESSSIRYGSSPIWLSGKLLIISMLSPPSDQMTKKQTLVIMEIQIFDTRNLANESALEKVLGYFTNFRVNEH